MTRITLDHCVIHVSDWEKARAFYVDVMGAEAVPFGNGYQFRWGEQQLNIHGPNQPGTPVAKLPVMPGGSDLCFRWHGPIETAIEHLQANGVTIEEGPCRALRRKGQGDKRLFPRSGRVADGVHVV
jgi:catechol 2,3-dioxygenase-like lactoylglutathione lyase family enzyme